MRDSKRAKEGKSEDEWVQGLLIGFGLFLLLFAQPYGIFFIAFGLLWAFLDWAAREEPEPEPGLKRVPGAPRPRRVEPQPQPWVSEALQEEAIAALRKLGLKATDAKVAVQRAVAGAQARREKIEDVGELVRRALKQS